MASIQSVAAAIAQSEEGVTIPIYQPSGEPYPAPDGKPCTITILGPESQRVLEAEKANRAKLRSVALDDDDQLEMEIDRAAAAVIDWSGWTEGEGDDERPAPCTPPNVKALLQAKHIRQQVVTGIARHGVLFTKRSA